LRAKATRQEEVKVEMMKIPLREQRKKDREHMRKSIEPLHIDVHFYLLMVTSTKFTAVVHDDHPSFLYCLMEWE